MEHFTLPHQHGQSKDQLMENIPSTENFQIIADIFKQLSDTTRIRIFWILCHCEECVINIAALMEMSRHHRWRLGLRRYLRCAGVRHRGVLPRQQKQKSPVSSSYD